MKMNKSPKITIKWNKTPSEIAVALALDDPQTRKFAHSQLRAFCEPYVPFRTGMLALHKAEVHENFVLYNVPYAKRMYDGRGGAPNRSAHPKATKEWDRAMLAEKREDFVAAIAQYIKEHGK